VLIIQVPVCVLPCFCLLIQVMYFVGVHAILKSLGIITNTTRVAGASGGSVAAAFSCGGASTPQFMTAAVTLAGLCNTPLANNCKGTLDSAVKTGLVALLPGETEEKCKDRLYVAVTRARQTAASATLKRTPVSCLPTSPTGHS